MASMAVATITSNLLQLRNPREMTSICSFYNNAGKSISFEPPKHDFSTSLLHPQGRGAKHFFQPMCAVQTGLKGPVPNFKDIDSTLKDAHVVVESRDDDTIQLRVDLTGWETHKVFDNVLTNLARVAPPLPGFRNTKICSIWEMVECYKSLSLCNMTLKVCLVIGHVLHIFVVLWRLFT
ncbi:hypothetical protein Scep_029194 [Stephania cephalantha]|uniref:Trigger factor ribosome-binding bacterial domain-containing protein n=1 Tax=Stephania cephalantha TaxID=152367 RepID=A0AAP0HC08_9MAGN